MRDRIWNTEAGSRLIWAALLVLALLLLAPPAWAQDDDEPEDPFAGLYRKPSIYLVATGNYQIPTQERDLERAANKRLDAMFGPGTETNVDNSWGLTGRLGYRFHERFAAETQFEWLNTVELDSQINTGEEMKTEIGMFALTGNVKGFLSGTGRFQPYVIGGAGWARARTNVPGPGANERDDGFVYRFGAGFDLYGKPDIGINVEASYAITEGGVEDLDYVSIGAGLVLRFFPGGY